MFPEWHHAVPESAYFKVPETLKTFQKVAAFEISLRLRRNRRAKVTDLGTTGGLHSSTGRLRLRPTFADKTQSHVFNSIQFNSK